MKIEVTIQGFIDLPESWKRPLYDEDGSKFDDDGEIGALFTAEYRYNDQLDADEAIDELAEKLKKYRNDFKFAASFCEGLEEK